MSEKLCSCSFQMYEGKSIIWAKKAYKSSMGFSERLYNSLLVAIYDTGSSCPTQRERGVDTE